MDLLLLNKIKELTIIAMISDDYLMERLVLKGGNAIDFIYKCSSRASVDVDFSMNEEFQKNELEEIESKIKNTLEVTFSENGFKAFDIKFIERPKKKDDDIDKFWGGYKIEFKILPIDEYKKCSPELASKKAIVVGSNNSKKFKVDISKFEFCDYKKEEDFEGYTLYVYSPEMIVFEKLRAICQQMPEYKEIIRSSKNSARARDFLDIYILIEHFKIDPYLEENKQLIKNIFKIKSVPIKWIKKIKEYKEFHEQDYYSLKDTVTNDFDLKPFEFYFDYVINKFENIF